MTRTIVEKKNLLGFFRMPYYLIYDQSEDKRERCISMVEVKSLNACYRIPLFSDACFNTMNRVFGAWSNIDLTIPMGHIVDTY
ncbi:hypothetical protein BpHYR1_038601 [Brachionus plicatilis]|uniref:Uncharacterized protein n=1 Tax=Brachionus plicatilis TaxID=10195 RepID=A0A3M7PQH9_BRAPC|nr:hypothetical protein BpHYR1_038601 [Brachionus plicatilis]